MKNIPGYVIAFSDLKLRQKAKIGLLTQAHNYLAICEQLRFIYDTIEEIEDENIKNTVTEQLIDAFLMAKKMQNRLIYYKKKYNDGSGSSGSKIVHLLETKKRKKIRKARII